MGTIKTTASMTMMMIPGSQNNASSENLGRMGHGVLPLAIRHHIQTVTTVNTTASFRNRRSLCRSRLTSTVPFTSPPSVSPTLN